MKKSIIFFSLLALLTSSNLANAAGMYQPQNVNPMPQACAPTGGAAPANPCPQYCIPTGPVIQTSPVFLYPVPSSLPTGGAAGVCPSGFYTGPVSPLGFPEGYQMKTGGAAPIRGYW